MQITIRRATLADASVLAEIGRRTFDKTFTGTCTEDDMQEFLQENFNIDQVKKELSDPGDLFFFAEKDGQVAGYMRLKEDYQYFELMKQWKSLELKRIYIDEPFMGKGIAQQLIDFAENLAKEKNYEVLWLGVWEHNYRAKRFYEKMGFKDSGHSHPFPIGNTPQTDNWFWKFLNATV